MLSLLEVRSIQAAKSKSSSCPRKNASLELWLICQALLVSKFGKARTGFRLIKCLASMGMWLCMHKVKGPFPACIAIALSGRFIGLVAW